jgi:hypothetical protein
VEVVQLLEGDGERRRTGLGEGQTGLHVKPGEVLLEVIAINEYGAAADKGRAAAAAAEAPQQEDAERHRFGGPTGGPGTARGQGDVTDLQGT